MRVTFINPVLGGDYSALDIAITTLATIINERSHHKAKILDFTFHRRNWKEKLLKHLKHFKPHVVGFSTNRLYLNYIIQISKEIKKFNPKIKIVYGGYHASVEPLKTVKIKEVDYVFTGDVEDTIVEFLDRLESGRDLSKLKGLWYFDGNKLIHNPGAFFNDLDSLPFLDWDLWEDLDLYLYFLGMLYFIGTRGCVYNCVFCEAKEMRKKVNGNYYRVMSPKRFAQEMAYYWRKYKHRGLRLIQVFDQIPTMDYYWLKDLAYYYKKYVGNPKKHPFSFFSRIDHLDERKIKLLSEMGCNMVRVGVEAGDEKIRNEILQKNLPDKKLYEVFRLLKKYDIKTTAYYILGVPGETKETITETIKVAKKLKADRSAFFIFKPFTPESLELAIQYGGRIITSKANKADNITFDAVISYPNLSTRDIEKYQILAYAETFLPRSWKIIKKHKHKYFLWLLTYLINGIRYGLDLNYLITYFHIYGYDIIYY